MLEYYKFIKRGKMYLILQKLFKQKEGNILLFGLVLIICLTLFIIFTYIVDTSLANKLTAIIASNLFVGRVPALSLGYASGLSHFFVISINILTELILVTILYPLFIYSFKGILKIKLLESFFEEVKQKKLQHQDKFEKYGKIGLFIFVFIPFWMTGPIVGAIIGYLIGLKHFTIMFIVFIATAIAITLWGFFLNTIVDNILQLDSLYIWILLLIIVGSTLYFKIKKRFKKS
ncbi:hypothetical protein CP985_01695 [Malaciobacter mytili LMG 24559]|uniref:Small multi-drug export protein n=2 Tax=Malaciobacter mytili TaxID=603050 RepID=A0AAX2AKM9_9BACT|nr:hypothetical protein CP985_01695 [Malaciobacter mytili LMG 24559]